VNLHVTAGGVFHPRNMYMLPMYHRSCYTCIHCMTLQKWMTVVIGTTTQQQWQNNT